VLGGVVALGEQAGGLDDHLGPEIAPGQVGGSRSARTRTGWPSTVMLVAVFDRARKGP
jgi:hypothetical protein